MTHLPLDVLGLISPILSRVEGLEGLRYPETWIFGALSKQERDRAWLSGELPTYSFDNIEEVLECARPGASRQDYRETILHLLRQHRFEEAPETLSPPPDYNLTEVFRRLAHRYFRWRGADLFIRQGRMEELHELGLRLPVAHFIRYQHAAALTTGYITHERALELPDQLGQLSTTAHGLRTVVNRGVSEGHLHFWGVLSAQEIWADQILHTAPAGALAGFERQDQRLFRLSSACMRLLALGMLHILLRPAELNPPFHLISYLDALYFARTRSEEREAHRGLMDALRRELGIGEIFRTETDWRSATQTPPWDRETGNKWHQKVAENFSGILPSQLLRHAITAEDEEVESLLRLIDPMLLLLRRRLQGGAPGQTSRLFRRKERIRDRVRLVERFHLGLHRMLLELRMNQERQTASPQGRRLRDFLHQVFFRYLIFQTQHWQLATQSGKTTGLRRFKLFYEAEQRKTLQDDVELKGLILQSLRSAGNLHTVEGRISPPPDGPDDLVPWVLGYAEGVAREQLEGFGLVLHFLKAEKRRSEDRSVSEASRTVRYGQIRRTTREQAFRVYRLLSRAHPAVPFIVGLDAANLELTTPPEVFAPAFRFLRDHPIQVRSLSQPWQRFGTYTEVSSLLKDRRLGLTYHVGEDFRHLLSGLRAIDEVLEFLNPFPGDRLGHAIALALDPERWSAHFGFQAIMPKQEWLDTLVWVHHLLGPGHELAGELGLEDRIQRLSREIFGNATMLTTVRRTSEDEECRAADRNEIEHDWSALTLYDAWHLRQLDPYSVDLEKLRRGEYRIRRQTPTGDHHRRWAHVQAGILREIDREVGSSAAYHLLDLYWHHDEVRKEGASILNLDMEEDRQAWIRLCSDVQDKMKRKVQERQLIVEINPSSNRLIGPLEGLEDHHVFRMTLDDNQKLARELRVTINTDDPGVFNTSLPHEYFLLGEILIRRGVPEADVETWLEWLRRNGEDASFVRNLPPPQDPRIQKILQTLKREKRSLDELLKDQERLGGFWQRLRNRGTEYWQEQLEHRAETDDTAALQRRIEELERQLGQAGQ